MTTTAEAELTQEIQEQLMHANQLLYLIQAEVKEIKNLTSAGGAFEQQVIKSAGLIDQLKSVQNESVGLNRAGGRLMHHTVVSLEQNNSL